MRALSASEWLAFWEKGVVQKPVQRALTLLAAACPETPPEDLARLSIGQRDERLMTLREWTFGPQLTCVTACPACGERLEFTVNLADIRTSVPEPQGQAFQLTLDGYLVDFRLPCTVDLREANRCPDRESMRTALIQRCIRSARRRDEEIAAAQLPAHVVEAVVASMAEHDPQADTQLSLTCPSCNHGWHALFDVVSFFWSEIEVWATRILREVHLLASAYGWREPDILSMSPLRREMYLSMVGV